MKWNPFAHKDGEKKAPAEKPAREPLHIDYDNLAVPEVHTGAVRPEHETEQRPQGEGFTVDYDELSIPEVHPDREGKK